MNKSKGLYSFMLEFLTMLLVFAIIAIICIQIFVKGKILSESAINENMAYVTMQNYSEMMRNYHGENLQSYLDADETMGNIATLYLDAESKLLIKVNGETSYLNYFTNDQLILSLEVVSKGSGISDEK